MIVVVILGRIRSSSSGLSRTRLIRLHSMHRVRGTYPSQCQ